MTDDERSGRHGGGSVWVTFPLPRLDLEPRKPVAIIRDQRTRKEITWLSRRQRGLARRSLNSSTLMPISKRKMPLTWEKGEAVALEEPEAE